MRRSPPSATADTHPAVDEGLSAPGRPEPSLPRRILVATFALALAAAGIGFAARALRGAASGVDVWFWCDRTGEFGVQVNEGPVAEALVDGLSFREVKRVP